MESYINTPTNFRIYYKNMRERIFGVKIKMENKLDSLSDDISELLKVINDNKETYKKVFKFDIDNYKEYQEERYINGELLQDSTKIFLNAAVGTNVIISKVVAFAKKLELIHKLERKISIYDRCLSLNLKEYTTYLRTYFTEVHKNMILEGYGYRISPTLGWICFNRIKNTCKRAKLDYKKTREKKKEILDRGGRIYNEEEAKWCLDNGIEYEYEDYKVYQNIEYIYELVYSGCKLPTNWHYKFSTADYRGSSVRGKSNEDLMKECEYDINKILELPLDVRAKLNMCIEIDKGLYLKFIRNENQTSVTYREANS